MSRMAYICCWPTIQRSSPRPRCGCWATPQLRVRLTEAAEARYLDRYDGRLADQGVRRLVEGVARASTRS